MHNELVMCIQITCEQVKEFTKTISSFHGKFSEEGPGTVGNDLDEGTYIRTYICVSSILIVLYLLYAC